MAKRNYSKIADTLKALTNSKRLQILDLVSEKEIGVNQLSKLIGTRKSNTSQHLAILRYLGFLKSRREGKRVFYSTKPGVNKLVKFLLKA